MTSHPFSEETDTLGTLTGAVTFIIASTIATWRKTSAGVAGPMRLSELARHAMALSNALPQLDGVNVSCRLKREALAELTAECCEAGQVTIPLSRSLDWAADNRKLSERTWDGAWMLDRLAEICLRRAGAGGESQLPTSKTRAD
ncbi:MAG: hypothetical protein ABIW76_24030 [Fibrobacteria bacterium]